MSQKKPVIVPSRELVEQMVAEYEALRVKEKNISDRKKVLSETIKAYAMENGVKDDKGSYFSDSEMFTYGATCKKSVKFDVDKASKFLQSRGYEECIKLVPEISESAVEKRVADGDITMEELEKITTTSTSYAVMVKAKEEIADHIQQSALAAKKKPKVLRRK